MSFSLDALARDSLVQIRLDREHYLGTGFVIAPGLVVTNAHVAVGLPQVWFDDVAYECTQVRRYPEDSPQEQEWPWPDLAELTVPGLPAAPVLLGPAFAGAEDVERLGEVRVATFDVENAGEGPRGLMPITKRLQVSITGDTLLGLGGGTLELGMSGSPVLDHRSGRVCGVVKSAAWARAQLRGVVRVPVGGWMIPLTAENVPATWWERNAVANPLGNRWRAVAADAESVQHILFQPDDRPEETTPANLLDPDAGVVPFEPRSQLDELLAWCRADTRTVVRLISGTSGAGKTRTARELCVRLREVGWVAGILRPTFRDTRWLQTLGGALTNELQVCVVVDDAEHRGTDVARILEEVREALHSAASTGLRVVARVVMLSRNEPDRFEEEFLSIDIEDDALARWIRSVQEPAILLPAAPPDPVAVLSRAWEALTRHLGAQARAAPLWPPDLSGRTTLDLYAIAADEAFSLLPDYVRAGSVDADPLETIRRHHLRFWSRKLKQEDYRLRPHSRPGRRPRTAQGPVDLPLIIAEAWLLVPTLVPATNTDRLRQVMTRVAQALGAPGPNQVDTLLALYPAVAGRPAGLTTDRLAEVTFRHVCRALDQATLYAFLAAVLLGEGTDVLLALRLICRSRAYSGTTHDRIDTALTSLLAEHARDLLPPFTRACGEIPQTGPLVELLTEAVAQAPPDIMPRIEEHLPDDGRGLSPVALIVLQRQVDACLGNDDRSLNDRVTWWRKLSLHQYHLGRTEAALATNQAAINDCRVLRMRGDEQAAMFARLHADRALFLLQQARMGRPGGALEAALTNGKIALDQYQKLGPQYATALADVLHNQDIMCSVANRSVQALEYGQRALHLYGDTGPRRARAAAHLQVADDLRRLGRLDEALAAADQGVAIQRKLFGEARSAYALPLVRALVGRAWILLQRDEHEQLEARRSATAGSSANRKDLIRAAQDWEQAEQVARRWLPAPEPGLTRLVEAFGVVLHEHEARNLG